MRRVISLGVFLCVVSWAATGGAQVDWDDMFPEEGKEAAAQEAPPPKVAPAPAAAPKVRREAPPEPAVEEPAAAPAPVRKRPAVIAPEPEEVEEKPPVAVPRVRPPAPAPAPQEGVDEEPPVAAPRVRPPAPAAPAEAAKKSAPPAESAPAAAPVEIVQPPVRKVAPAAVPVERAAPRPAVAPREHAETEEVEPEQPPARRAPVERAADEKRAPVPRAATGIPAEGDVQLADLGFQEGDFINVDNVDRAANVLSPGMMWGVKYGWELQLIEPRHIELPSVYREATEKYSKQVAMVRDGLMLENYVAGQPFPVIDTNDPDAAKKIMWNFYYRAEITDDVDVRLFEGDTGEVGQNQPMKVERHYLIDHLRQLNYNGRLVVDPKPDLPNPDGFRRKESLGPLLEPFDLKGVGGMSYRYLDPVRQDDTWLYLPQLRRVRRLSSAQRSDALFGQDSDVDSYYGYNGHVAWNTYRLLGEKVILATMHSRNVPVEWQEPANYFFKDVWEPRRVWVVEAISTLPQYAYSKRVLFLDKEAYVIPYSDIYDRAGQLWKIWVHQYGFRKKTLPNLPTSTEYDDEMAFVNAVTILDTQLAHSTRAAQPTTKARGEEGRYINMGAKAGTVEEAFTVARMIEEGH